MIGFAEVYTALQAGRRVRREHWDSDSVLFVRNGELMFSCRGAQAQFASQAMPIDWRDMNAIDWSVLPAA